MVITSLRVAMIDLHLAKPLAADLREQPGRVRLVEADRARRAAIGKGEPVQIVEEARPSLRREAMKVVGYSALLALMGGERNQSGPSRPAA